MSSIDSAQITCPKCGKTSDFTIWSSINTSLNPSTKDSVRDGSLFMFHCDHCGHQTHVTYNFLYHQMEDNIMIPVAMTEEAYQEYATIYSKDSKLRKMFSGNYTIRLVNSFNTFREKLSIFDAGLDDRIVELIKCIYIAQIHNQNPNVEIEDVFFFTTDDDEKVLEFISDNEVFASAYFDETMYAKVCEAATPRLLPPDEEEIIIDLDWAYSNADHLLGE